MQTRSAVTGLHLIPFNPLFVKQVDKTQPFNDNNEKQINVFEEDSVNIVSGISFNS